MKTVKWFKNISISKKLYFVVGIMALLIAIELFTLWFSLNTLSSVRAFVGGEGLWSKAEKDAVYHLQKYSRTFNEKDYLKFQEFLKVPLGDHKTLLELKKKNPDPEKAKQGFIEGRNHPHDVEGMIKLFRRFHSISYIKKAITVWTEADSTITLLTPIGERLHAEINKRSPDEEKIDDIVSEIDPINEKLTMLEDNFSYTLGEGSRWLEDIILTILFVIVLTVEFTGMFLTISVSIGITKGINEIMRISSRVSKADFSDKAKIYSKDEIGLLASSFNKMIDDLQENINERVHMEQVLRKQKDLYESLIETQSEMGQGISITENKKIIYANDALCKMYGYSKDEILKLSSFLDIVIPEEKEKLSKRLSQRLLGIESGDTGETVVIRKDGKKINIEYSIKVINSDERMQILSVIRDITLRKKSEEDLKEKTLELIRSNTELEQFAYVASHDLQEPLRMISSYVQLIKERYTDGLDQDAKDFIGFAIDGANRMRNLIQSLLEYSRVNRVKPFEQIDTNELLKEVLQNLKDKIKEHNTLIKIEKLPDIFGDNVLIGQLFQNLIENAIKFKGTEDPQITISCKTNINEFLFSVKDNGIGIPKEYSERIFIILQRLHTIEKYPGTGIGLAICKKIVERHGGKIWVESEVNKGSTFYFTIKKYKKDSE
ncbi:MAG: sensor histidine kinase [Bacteroidia bacterium]